MTDRVPYFDDPVALYQRLSGMGTCSLLDSGGSPRHGRWDIVAAKPRRTLRLVAEEKTDANVIQGWAMEGRALGGPPDIAPSVAHLPFHGGLLGHLSYDLGRQLRGLTDTAHESSAAALPQLVIHDYDWAVVQDRVRRESWLTGAPDTETTQAIQHLLQAPSAPEGQFNLLTPFLPSWDFERYTAAFDQAQRFIADGDCYQINLAQPYRARYQGDLATAYARLRPIAQAPFSALFPLDHERLLLSLSPERFLTVEGQVVETRPIKGTRPRSRDESTDAEAARELLASEKERAENLMIVDLMRNDLGRFCDTGSVAVDELFGLESYATVHHLVSVIRGRLRADETPLSLLLGCLPGGSITGAPKKRAMEIIDELEPAARQAWCGSIFYWSRHGRMDSSITIRTLFNQGDELHCWAGGGLVHDSRAQAEYQELEHKVGAFLHCLEQGLDLSPQGH